VVRPVAFADLASEVAAGALVIDTRPIEQRQRDGQLPGALISTATSWSGGWTLPAHTTLPRQTVQTCA
jgi:hypothetical protein